MSLETTLEDKIDFAARLIVDSRRLVVFTGAGISTESGLPDFRGPEGLWTKHGEPDFRRRRAEPERPSTPEDATDKARQVFIQESRWTGVQPNAAHYAIADLQKMGKLDFLISQNIDNLHLMSGISPDTISELHGNVAKAKCVQCAKYFDREEIRRKLLEDKTLVPSCDECGGAMKSSIVDFGDPMPFNETREAEIRSRNCDLLFVIGSTLLVTPAAYMPKYALESGAKLIILNMGETPFDRFALVRFDGKAGEIVPKIVERVKEILREGQRDE